MSKFANISGIDAAKAFEKVGWQKVGQVGSHLVMKNKECEPIYQLRNTANSRLERSEP